MVVAVWSFVLSSAVVSAISGVPVSDGGVELSEIQRQLQKLQSDLENLKLKESAHQKTEAQTDEGTPNANGMFYDKPMIPQARVQQRQIGWQPLKRGVSDNLSQGETFPRFAKAKKDGFAKAKKDNSLQGQLIQAVEHHLLNDLATAKSYGIEPYQILDDLRQKKMQNGI